MSKKSLSCAVLTISDTRTAGDDTAGNWLAESLAHAGHDCRKRDIVKADIHQIRRVLSDWIADATIQVILTTGGTGFSPRDNTPAAVTPLLDRNIDGFGELFRQVSFEAIGSSTIQSRALGGIANDTLIFCLPGSNNACRTAWERILLEQLDSEHEPCNFATYFGDHE